MTTAYDEYQQMCAELDFLRERIRTLEAGIEQEAVWCEETKNCVPTTEFGRCMITMLNERAARLRTLLEKK